MEKEEVIEGANEYNDGALDQFISSNREDLIAEFIDENNFDWIDFCKSKFNEVNE